MPVTKLDDRCALIVIDLQKGIVSIPTAHPASEIVSRSARLAAAFRQHGLPVVWVNVTGQPSVRTDVQRPKAAFPPDWTELAPELGVQATDLRITKQCAGAFPGTSLDAELRQRGVTQVFLAGISTGFGVESTLRTAYDMGYNVVAVVDAMTDRAAETHNFCVEKVFPRMAETATVDEVLRLLAERPERH